MGCLFCIPEREEEPGESLYIPLLNQQQAPLYRINSTISTDSFEKSVCSNSPTPIQGSLTFRPKSKTPPPVFESCVEEQSPSMISMLQDRVERLEKNTQENLRLLSDDVHLIYQKIVDEKNSELEEELVNPNESNSEYQTEEELEDERMSNVSLSND